MDYFGGGKRFAAIQQFRQARKKAALRSLLAKFTGKKDELLPFDEISKELGLTHPNLRYLDNIPLDSIVGSVSRYLDFNRQFYPLSDSDEQRWAKVNELVEVQGLEPIEVYKVGEVYFVLDGNHRVSVARQLEAMNIEAFVNEFRSKVEVTAEDEIQDVVLRVEHAELMEDTFLDKVRPDVEIRVTLPGRYREIYQHIEVHRYYLGLEQKRRIPMEVASASWVDFVYLPVVEVIRDRNVLADFPGRTETDLYLWLKKHQWELEAAIGKKVTAEDAVYDLLSRFGQGFWHKLTRFLERVISKSKK